MSPKKQILLVLIVASISLTACGAAAETEPIEASTNASSEEWNETEDSIEDVVDTDGVFQFTELPIEGPDEASFDWSSDPLQLDNQMFSLPIPYTELTTNWTFDTAIEDPDLLEDTILSPTEEPMLVSLARRDDPDVWMLAYFANLGDKDLPLPQADIVGLSLDHSYGNPAPALQLPGAVSWGSSAQDLLDAYGKPSEAPMYFASEKETIYIWATEDEQKILNLTTQEEDGLIRIFFYVNST